MNASMNNDIFPRNTRNDTTTTSQSCSSYSLDIGDNNNRSDNFDKVCIAIDNHKGHKFVSNRPSYDTHYIDDANLCDGGKPLDKSKHQERSFHF